jgi:hypothetical protein
LKKILASFNQFVLQPIDNCGAIIEEGGDMKRQCPEKRVETMFKQILDISNQNPAFLLCLLPEKNCDIYGLLCYLSFANKLFIMPLSSIKTLIVLTRTMEA